MAEGMPSLARVARERGHTFGHFSPPSAITSAHSFFPLAKNRPSPTPQSPPTIPKLERSHLAVRCSVVQPSARRQGKRQLSARRAQMACDIVELSSSRRTLESDDSD